MINMLSTIEPKTDQLNADSLIGRTMTIKITKVLICSEGEQPIAVSFEGDGGKPYKPGKSMRRVMVHLWGPDGSTYAGKSLTLYRDEKVLFGGVAVGGIRISHMSHIERETTMALTATKAHRRPFTVKPLVVKDAAPELPEAAPKRRTTQEFLEELARDLDMAPDPGAVEAIARRPSVHAAIGALSGDALSRLQDMLERARARMTLMTEAAPEAIAARAPEMDGEPLSDLEQDEQTFAARVEADLPTIPTFPMMQTYVRSITSQMSALEAGSPDLFRRIKPLVVARWNELKETTP